MNIFRVNIHQILYALEICGRFTCTWPQNLNAGKMKLIVGNLGWCVSMLNVILAVIPLMLACYYRRDDIVVLMKALSELTALIEVFLDLIFCRINSDRLQALITNIKSFLETADERELRIVQDYVNRYKRFFSTMGMMFIAAGFTFSLGPLFLAQNLPGEEWYPFSTEPLPIYCVIYGMQCYSILQTAFCISVDLTIAVLFSFPSARLDMLGMEIHGANTEKEMIKCVKKHQDIIRFVNDTQSAVQNLVFKANVTMGFAVMCGAFPLIYNQPLAVVSQFLCMVVGGCGRLYVIAWPADDLRESSQRFTFAVYNCEWTNKSRRMMNSILIIIQRSQHPLLITMGGLLPPLSLEYFATFITTIMSYFMTMRAVIEDK